MKLLKDYFDLQQKIYDYFGYVEDWRVIPLDDQTDEYWFVTGGTPGEYCHSRIPFTRESIMVGSHICGGLIYTQRFLPRWVYRGPEYTMVCADTRMDGNKLLMVFDNGKECRDPELIQLYQERWGDLQ